jgi:hypothetical protein
MIEILSIPEVKCPHRLSHGTSLGRNHHQVDMIGHQAVGQDFQPMLLSIASQQQQVASSVRGREEDVLMPVPTLYDVVRHSSHNRSSYSRHAE